jgi:hypothetical protein
MNIKSFQAYLEKRISKKEVACIEKQARLEKRALQALQDDISKAAAEYVAKENTLRR